MKKGGGGIIKILLLRLGSRRQRLPVIYEVNYSVKGFGVIEIGSDLNEVIERSNRT
jgi:hypothetical protein